MANAPEDGGAPEREGGAPEGDAQPELSHIPQLLLGDVEVEAEIVVEALVEAGMDRQAMM